MIITVVCDVLGEENNGTTIAAMNLIRYLRGKGHEVRVVCSDEKFKGEEGYYIVPSFNFGIFNGYISKNGVSLAKPDNKILKEAICGADVVHIMMPFALGHRAALTARKLGIPITAGFHCQAENITNHFFMMNVGFVNRIVYRIFYKNLYRYCDCVHYPSRFICDLFEKEVGETNHYVISNGVNKIFKRNENVPDEFGGKFVILFTGRYSKEKSHKVLIDGVALSKHEKDIRLIFAGEGPLKEKLKKYSAKKLSNQPIFGFFSRLEIIKIINRANLYVHPAEIEIEAISCLEAISCGTVPVISDSERSATRYFALGDKNLFKCNNSENLAERIDYWYEHPEELKACGAAYLGYAEQFDFDKCMKEMENMLYNAAEKRK